MRAPRVIRTVQFDEFGDAGVLKIVERETPRPGPGEVLVEVIAAGTNHIEGMVRAGRLADEIPSEFPQTQGTDFAGIVRELGDGVTAFKRGAEVVGHTTRSAHATYVVVPAANLVVKPRTLIWEVAGALYLAGLAAIDTVDSLHLGAGDTLVVSAAAGGVGSIETQLARLSGATVIGTCSERNFDYLRQQGVKPVLYGEGMADRIRQLAPRGVTAFVDNFGQDGHEVAADLGVDPSRFRSSLDRKAIEVAALTADAEFEAHATRQLQRLVTLAATGAISVLISGFYPLDHVADACDDLDKLHSRGKIVLGMHPASPFRVLKARDVADSRG